MNRPGDGESGDALAVLIHLGSGPDHVMENVATTNRLAPGACAGHVIDLDHFNRLHIAVFGQASRCGRNLTPPIRSAREFGDVVHHHNQIGLSRAPFDAVVEDQRFWRISDVTLRSAGTGPG